MADVDKPRPGPAGDELERARRAYEQHAWDEAFGLLQSAEGREALGTEDLQRLAWSAALVGRDSVMLETCERLYHAYVEREECLPAARAAFWLGLRLMAKGEPARGSGWLARAQRIVDREQTDCVEQGYLLLPRFHRHYGSKDFETARAIAEQAAAIGERFDEPDLIAFARVLQGQACVCGGLVDEGLALLDEAMVAAASGELSPLVTGLVYCSAIAGCDRVRALGRAREWTAALAKWCEQESPVLVFNGRCLVHRAEVLQIGGAWNEAVDEARRATERYSDAESPDVAADAHYQRAEIHRLRGELEAAEEAYRDANRFGREPQPGLALLRLAQGDGASAAATTHRVLGAISAPLDRARFLPAHVEITLACGDVEAARAAAEELETIARVFGTEVLGAMADHARGAVALAQGDAASAVAPLRRAFATWQRVGAPYIAARIRVALARACEALGDGDGARLELDAARRVFEELGAGPDLARLDSPKPRAPATHGLSPRELEVLRLVAQGKTNRAIASELGISERTIDRHLSNIFIKLDVSSRSAATAFAYRHDLV